MVLKYVFIVPYRNRTEHKLFFENYMKYLLEDYKTDEFMILFSNQNNNLPFNRGAMKNIGFLYIKELYPNDYKNIIFIFNDVDTLPYKKNLLNYDVLDNTINHYYGFRYALGGIFAIKGSIFEKINGFPNYWSWGYEDTIIHNRAIKHKIKVNRDTFFNIGSHKILQLYDGIKRNMEIANIKKYNNSKNELDGLNTLKNINYNFNMQNVMLDINHFDSLYKPEDVKLVNYDLRNGDNISLNRPTNNFHNKMTSLINTKRK